MGEAQLKRCIAFCIFIDEQSIKRVKQILFAPDVKCRPRELRSMLCKETAFFSAQLRHQSKRLILADGTRQRETKQCFERIGRNESVCNVLAFIDALHQNRLQLLTDPHAERIAIHNGICGVSEWKRVTAFSKAPQY